jgi:hypothetical protein
MTKALLGARLGPTELALLDEVRRLRARVAELELELATRADGAGAEHTPAVPVVDVPAPAVR